MSQWCLRLDRRRRKRVWHAFTIRERAVRRGLVRGSHNGAVAGSEGTPAAPPRGGARRAARPRRRLQPKLLALGLGSIVALVAWAALVWLAIDSGRSARGGDAGRWGYLAAASVGAVASLFVCLWLGTLLLRRVGILDDTRRPVQTHRH